MKKLNILMIMLITSFVFMACEKEEATSNNTTEKNKSEYKENTKKGNKVGAGDFIDGEGWLGWLDPELVGEDEEIPEKDIWQGKIRWYGYVMDEANGIACPKEGDNCGPLKAEGEDGLPVTVGVYLVDEGKNIKSNTKSLNDYRAGDFIDGDGWLGWLDPEKVGEDEDILLGEIYKMDPDMSGYRMENGIVCPDGKSGDVDPPIRPY